MSKLRMIQFIWFKQNQNPPFFKFIAPKATLSRFSSEWLVISKTMCWKKKLQMRLNHPKPKSRWLANRYWGLISWEEGGMKYPLIFMTKGFPSHQQKSSACHSAHANQKSATIHQLRLVVEIPWFTRVLSHDLQHFNNDFMSIRIKHRDRSTLKNWPKKTHFSKSTLRISPPLHPRNLK